MPTPQILQFNYTVGDTAPQLLLQYADSNTGSPVNITNCTATLYIKQPSGSVVSVAATIYDAPNGKAAIEWQGTEFVAGQGQPAELVLVSANGLRRTYQNIIFNVAANLAD